MIDEVLCLDTTVLVKYLVIEESREESEAAVQLVGRGLAGGRLVAPAWAWAEVGSVLRKKVRQRLISTEQAAALWSLFARLPVHYLDLPMIRARAWELAARYSLPTLYDAAFLACTELAPAPIGAVREFWTADETLLRSLGPARPGYVRRLGV